MAPQIGGPGPRTGVAFGGGRATILSLTRTGRNRSRPHRITEPRLPRRNDRIDNGKPVRHGRDAKRR
jgi:hypothetical protein